MKIHATLPVVLALTVALCPRARGSTSSDPPGAVGLAAARQAAVAVVELPGQLALAASSWSGSIRGARVRVGAPDPDAALSLALEPVYVSRAGWEMPLIPGAVVRGEGRLERPVAPGIRELLDLRADGLELSYAFDQRPPGSGDLVVTLAVVTGLEAPRGTFGEEGLSFAGAAGVVHVGAVVGVDAAGERIAGALRFDGARLELVLPGTFVDEAAYPLVLDPLVGVVSAVTSSNTDSAPDVAYDADSGRWAVVWNRQYAGLYHFAVMQVLSSSGAPVGGPIALSVQYANTRPVVCNIDASGRFLFACRGGAVMGGDPISMVLGTVRASDRSYDPSRNRTSSTPGVLAHLDLGGDPFNAAVVVYGLETGRVGCRLYALSSTGSISPGPSLPVLEASGAEAARPSVSASNGSAGRWYLAWATRPSTSATTRIRHAVVDWHGALVHGPSDALFDPALDFRDPACTGDGSTYALSYVRDGDVDEVRVDRYATSGDGFFFTGRSIVDTASALVSLKGTAVEWTGSGYAVAWRSASWGSTIRAASLHPTNLALCEAPFSVLTGFMTAPRLYSPASSRIGLNTGTARAVWSGIAAAPLGSGVFTGLLETCP